MPIQKSLVTLAREREGGLQAGWPADPPTRSHLGRPEPCSLELPPHLPRPGELVEENRRARVARLGHLPHPGVAGLGEPSGPEDLRAEDPQEVHHARPRDEPERLTVRDAEEQRAVGGERAPDAPERLDAERAAGDVIVGAGAEDAVERARGIGQLAIARPSRRAISRAASIMPGAIRRADRERSAR